MVSDLITRAMILIGTITQGETASSDELADALYRLNTMLDGWNTDRLCLLTDRVVTGNFSGATQNYTIGTGGDIDTDPVLIIRVATVTIPGTTISQPLSILDSPKWAAIVERGLTGLLPDKLYCNYDFPLATLRIHPIPSGTIAFEMFLWSALTSDYDLADTIDLRPGYQEAIEYNLAVKLAPSFGVQLDPTVIQLAVSYKQQMRELNAQALGTALDPAGQALQIPNVGQPIIGGPPPQPQQQ